MSIKQTENDMKKSSKIILTTVLTLGVAGGVFAFGAHHHFSNMSPQDKAEMISDRVDRKLDLTEMQKSNLDTLTFHIADLMQEVRENKQGREEMLNDILTDGPVDQAALLQKINDKTMMINNKAPEVVAKLAGFMDSLDAQQKAKIEQMIEKRKGHRFGHRGFAE
jgi:Spy/CpxP family protein refolding chaperone